MFLLYFCVLCLIAKLIFVSVVNSSNYGIKSVCVRLSKFEKLQKKCGKNDIY